MKLRKLMIGKFYMRSGNVIPFAVEKLEWKEDTDLDHLKYYIKEYNGYFHKLRGIGVVKFIDFTAIESITIDKTRWCVIL